MPLKKIRACAARRLNICEPLESRLLMAADATVLPLKGYSLPTEQRALLGDDAALFAFHPGGPTPQLAAELSAALTTTGSDEVVAYRFDDPTSEPILPQTAISGPLIGLDTFRVDPRFAGIDGGGFASVIIDDGIDLDHPFFGPDADHNGIADRIVYQHDFANNDNNASDFDGHGSNVAGIVGSQDDIYPGLAPATSIIALKVFPDNPNLGASSADIEAALQWVVANAATYNVASVNLSLGAGNFASALNNTVWRDEFSALSAMGVICVAAAGNAFYTQNSAVGVANIAADPNVLAVGATLDSNRGSLSWGDGARDFTTAADRIVSFSQRHATLTDIFAPGVLITSASFNGGTITEGGTSQASPHIAGIATLMQDLATGLLGRRLSFAEYRSLLQATGVSIVDGDDENDNVTNTNLTFKRVNLPALAQAVYNLQPAPVGDRFEPNDTFAAATDLGTLGDRTEASLSIHAAGNDDYYRFVSANSGMLNVDLTFSHAAGDLDFALFDVAQHELTHSNGVLDNEHISFIVGAGQAYYLRVYGYQQAVNSNYGLQLHGPMATAGATPLLPDLYAWADEAEGFIYGWTIDSGTLPGRRLLRLTTAVPNVGAGPMELRGGAALPSGTQEVYQRIYQSDGSFTDRLAGTFTYHPSHGHIHFDDYAQYLLRAIETGGGVGGVVAAGDKTSFCLEDITDYDLGLPGAPASGQYFECGQIQGISVGWADVYDQSLPDQWIDVTDVPDGDYWLEVDVDPDDHLLEADEANNTARIEIHLTAPPPLGPDRFEPNDSFVAATNLGTLGDRTEVNLSIDSAGDDDYFRFTAAANGQLTANLLFSHANGDLDFQLFDAAHNQLARSESVDDNEQVVWNITAGQTYFLHVYGYAGAVNPVYTLAIDGPGQVASVVGRRVFYNGSRFDRNGMSLDPGPSVFDDTAVAFDKNALLPNQFATFLNYTSYNRGLNGVMVDIAQLANPGTLSAADFQFRVGNSNTPSSWSPAPAPIYVTVRPGAGTNLSDRVTLIWADGAIRNQWLEIRVLATRTGLAKDDVFYFGNAVAETGNSPFDAFVDSVDEVAARSSPHSYLNLTTVDDLHDFNRDGLVNATDQVLARTNNTQLGTSLLLIHPPIPATLTAASLPAELQSLHAEDAATVASAVAMANSGKRRPAWAALVDAALAERDLCGVPDSARLWPL